jgi:hypothetical protein
MLQFLRRVLFSDYGPPPPPNTAVLPSFPGERMVQVIYSESKKERVFITVDPSGLYNIHGQRWDDSDWKDCGKAFWTHASSTGGRTDSIDTARGIAAEELRCW